MELIPRLLAICFLSLVTPYHDEGTLSASRSVSIEKPPEIMRLKMQISASGPDLKHALAKLKHKRESAVRKLRELGVTEQAIKIEGPKLGVDPLEAATRRVGPISGLKEESDTPSREKAPPKTHVALLLQADWVLKISDDESLLSIAQEIQDKVRQADLAGLGEEEPTEEEKERIAENKDRLVHYSSSSDQIPTGEPLFGFICRITEADRAALIKTAFAKAKADVEKLALAASVQLGSPARLSVHGVGSDDDWKHKFSYAGPDGYEQRQRVRALLPEDTEEEAVSEEPGRIKFNMEVTVEYLIAPSATAPSR